MNVLQLVTSFDPFYEEQIRVLESNGLSCTILDVPNGGDSDRSVIDYARFYGTVLRTVARENFDLVHANYGLTAPMALAQPQGPVVLSLWGSDVFGKYSRVSKACARAASEVIVMSEEMAAEIGGSPSVIPHGVNFDWFEPQSKSEARTDVGWDHDGKHVLFPWAPERAEKNYPRAERIVAAVSDELSDPVELHAVTGVPHERMPAYMNAADVLLLTSNWEGSPNSVREALACNLPVVATDVGDVSDHVAGLELSRVCQSDAELVDALRIALTASVSPKGREHVRDLNLENMGTDIIEVYDRALS